MDPCPLDVCSRIYLHPLMARKRSGNTDMLKEPVLPLTMGQKAANAALAKYEDGRYKASVEVIDQVANVKVLLRRDGAGLHPQGSSVRKAYTASNIRRSTQELAELIIKLPNLQAM